MVATGSVSCGFEFESCSGAETGGGMISAACEPGSRSEVKSR